MSERPAQTPPAAQFRPLRLVMVVLLVILTISGAAQWYASRVTLPRYCADPAVTLANVERLLTERRPAGDGDRKPYIIAARLTFLIPRNGNEALADYLQRLRQHLEQQCR